MSLGSKYIHKDANGRVISTSERRLSSSETAIAGAVFAYGAWSALSNWANSRKITNVLEALNVHRFDDAINNASSLIRHNSSDAYPYLLRGVAYSRANRIREAIADFSYAISLDNNLHEAFAERADCYSAQREWANAVQDMSTAIQISPNNAEYWLWRGIALIEIGNLDQSLADINKSIALQPGNSKAYTERARLHLQRDDVKNSIQDYSSAIALTPNNATLFRLRSEAYIKQGNTIASAEDLNQATKLEELHKAETKQNESITLNQKQQEYIAKGINNLINWGFRITLIAFIIPIFLGVISLIIYFQALSRMKAENTDKDRGKAIFGIILAFLSILYNIFIYSFFRGNI